MRFLDYGSSAHARQRMWANAAIIAAAVGLALWVARFVTIRETYRMDAITGSTERQTIWPLGISSRPRIDASPLELRLNRMGVRWNRSWSFTNETEWSILGCARGCGGTPPIFQLRPFMDQLVDASTDSEVRQFVAVMQSGTNAQQTAAIEAALEKVMR